MAEANLIGGVIGGMLIGLAASLLLLWNGRIAGVSGILGGVILPNSYAECLWRGTFIFGLIGGAAIFYAATGQLSVQLQADSSTLLIAGLLVGAGTRLGSGCTSGHGVCGLARRSPRSLAATTTFMLFGVLTVFLVHHVIF